MSANDLAKDIVACRICEKHLPHGPRPIVQFSATASILIIGQAPGTKVHESGVPWDDASGDRLCEWTGLSKDQLHDGEQVALMPMGFCYPGKASGGDKPPRPECAPQWHDLILATLPENRLILLVGTYAQQQYLPETKKWPMRERVERFDEFAPGAIPLPHPSWRSTMFMRKNPWFESELLPELRALIAQRIR